MNEIFEKIYNDNNTNLNEDTALFEKVYTEAEMLNEMNPKLKALLAAGLIGTAGLGAVSCSMPTDDPTIYEQPAPETANPVPTVTFGSLGVKEYAESLARAIKDDELKSQLLTDSSGYTDLIYKDDFVPIEFTEKLTYAKFNIQYKKDKLSILINATIINNLKNIKKDIEKISYVSYILELTEQVSRTHFNESVFDMAIAAILKINAGYDGLVIMNILELKYLDYLGVTPIIDCCSVCGTKTNIKTLSSSAGGFVCNKCFKNDYIVLGNENVLVTKQDGRTWHTKEPAIMFFYKKRWFNSSFKNAFLLCE